MFGFVTSTKAVVLTVAATLLAAGPVSGSDSIKIGMTSALTGPYNEFGEGNRRAV